MIDQLYVALVHGPILNKRGNEVTTSVTNLDIHDIARSCRTFGVKQYFIITPINAQHILLQRILAHWETAGASEYNPDRQDALALIEVQNTLEDAIAEIGQKVGQPLIAVTAAKMQGADGEEIDLIRKAQLDKRPILLVFGTGWGLPASIIERADFRLNPIYGSANDGYNHLSVRSAVAIYLARLQGSL